MGVWQAGRLTGSDIGEAQQRSPVALSELKVRCWYTIDGDRPQHFWVDYAQQLPVSSVTGRFVKLTTPRPSGTEP